jgi:circadian clock protein KaiB
MASTRRSRETPKKKASPVRSVAARPSGGKKARPVAAAPDKPVKAKAAPQKPEAAKKAKAASQDAWNLRLYIAGDSPKSRSALANLRRLCETHLGRDYNIEVVDLKTRPELAKADQILALPTLIRKIPEPMKRVIGDLSNAERALVGLDLGNAVKRA